MGRFSRRDAEARRSRAGFGDLLWLGVGSGIQETLEVVAGESKVLGPALEQVVLGRVDPLIGTGNRDPRLEQALRGGGVGCGLQFGECLGEFAAFRVVKGGAKEQEIGDK